MSHSYSSRQPINFEQWRLLASEDPERFEARRREVIESLIAEASVRCQRRLRGLQWRIDQIRDHSSTPMAACVELSNMMWDAFAGEDGLVEALNRQEETTGQDSIPAEVVQLRQPPE